MEGFTDNRKRVRGEFDDSPADSSESKLARVNSESRLLATPCTTKANCNVNSSKSEQGGSGAGGAIIDLAGPEEIQDELLDILEDSERDAAIQGLELDSFIRSFEEEIQPQPPSVEPSSGENESPQAELGYLYEASDDELGLPPTGKMEPEAVGFVYPASPGVFELGGNLGFGDEIPCYDSFELGIGIGPNAAEENGFVPLGGLFDYSDAPFWPESLPAL